MRAFALADLIGLALAEVNHAAAQKSSPDPFTYCRSAKNTEADFNTEKTPKAISAAMKGWPTVWRCMDGDVYACATDDHEKH